MERKTARPDYVPNKDGAHSREAFRSGHSGMVRRRPKVKYWTAAGTPAERRVIRAGSGWPVLDWNEEPPPMEHRQRVKG